MPPNFFAIACDYKKSHFYIFLNASSLFVVCSGNAHQAKDAHHLCSPVKCMKLKCHKEEKVFFTSLPCNYLFFKQYCDSYLIERDFISSVEQLSQTNLKVNFFFLIWLMQFHSMNIVFTSVWYTWNGLRKSPLIWCDPWKMHGHNK